MEKKAIYKKILVGYDEKNVEHKDENGNLLYVDHIKEPIYEQQVEYVDYTEEELIGFEIYDLKKEISKWKEDVEQVELFGMERADYEQKKARCAEIILRLRELESNLKNN